MKKHLQDSLNGYEKKHLEEQESKAKDSFANYRVCGEICNNEPIRKKVTSVK